MRKLGICLLVLLMVMLCITAYADQSADFELRNGIHFGESPETIKSKETSKLTEDLKAVGSEYYPYTSARKVICYSGEALGKKDVAMRYYFNDQDELVDFVYVDRDSYFNSGLVSEADYEDIRSALIKKYGEPYMSENGLFPIFGMSYLEYQRYHFQGLKYSEWVIPCNDYYVKIDLIFYNLDYSGEGFHLGYSIFTQADLEKYAEELENKTEAINNDI